MKFTNAEWKLISEGDKHEFEADLTLFDLLPNS
jgi:hypothetical protein